MKQFVRSGLFALALIIGVTSAPFSPQAEALAPAVVKFNNPKGTETEQHRIIVHVKNAISKARSGSAIKISITNSVSFSFWSRGKNCADQRGSKYSFLWLYGWLVRLHLGVEKQKIRIFTYHS